MHETVYRGELDEIIEKMVDGRMRKFYEEVCLLEQTFKHFFNGGFTYSTMFFQGVFGNI